MKTISLSYEEAKRVAERLWELSSVSANVLNSYPKGAMGLTPDSVRATPEWKADKAEADRTFRALQDWNKVYTKQFKKERQADRAAKFAALTARNAK